MVEKERRVGVKEGKEGREDRGRRRGDELEERERKEEEVSSRVSGVILIPSSTIQAPNYEK